MSSIGEVEMKALTDDEMERYRAEEEFRYAVREELHARTSPAGIRERTWAFFNSQVGGWLLGTVLVGLTSFGYASYKESQSAIRDGAQKDVELVTKLLPELAKIGSPDSILSIAMLKHLRATKGIDGRLAALVDDALAEAARASAERAASATEGTERSAYVATAEAAVNALGRSSAESSPETHSESATQSQTSAPLPPTVYLQIADESQRGLAEQLRTRLRALGLPAPGIEDRGHASPATTDVRYYFDSDRATADKVVAAVREIGIQVAAPRKMQAVPTARPGLLEVWFGRDSVTTSPVSAAAGL
jgi:hypothetical protein